VRWDSQCQSIGQNHTLSGCVLDLFLALPDVWMFLPQTCMSFSSELTVDGGILTTTQPDHTVSTSRFYTEDRYRLRLRWDHTSREHAHGLFGFFRSFRFQEVLIAWADGHYYHMVLANSPNVHQVGAMDDWYAEVELVGDRLLPRDVNATRVTEDEALHYAEDHHERFLNLRT
jgi:hypothetical protein